MIQVSHDVAGESGSAIVRRGAGFVDFAVRVSPNRVEPLPVWRLLGQHESE